MKLRYIVHWVAFSMAPWALAQGQGNMANPAGRGTALVKDAKSADAAWSVLSDFVSSRGAEKKLDIRDPDALGQGDLYVQASLAAYAFYTAHPKDKRAAEAKKLEAIYAVRAAYAGASDFKKRAAALGANFRADKKNSAKDRFDVALMMEGMAINETLKGKRLIDDGVSYERLADTLQVEIGDTDEVYGLYLSIAQTADVATATRVAAKLVAQKKAPKWVMEPAQIVLDRAKLIGKALDYKLKMAGGEVVDLGATSSRPTVLFLWSVMDGWEDSQRILNHFREKLPEKSADSVRWLHVSLGGKAPVSDTPIAGSAFASTHAFISPQFGNPLTDALKVTQAPYAFVIGRDGKVVGYGFPENIPALLQQANR